MSDASRPWILIACIVGFIGVAGGAFGAHALEGALSDRAIETWNTGARYAMFHLAAFVAVAWRASLHPHDRLVPIAGVAFTVGVLVFTGSLWTLSLTGLRWLGAITPLGGVSLLSGWLALGVHAWKSGRAAG